MVEKSGSPSGENIICHKDYIAECNEVAAAICFLLSKDASLILLQLLISLWMEDISAWAQRVSGKTHLLLEPSTKKRSKSHVLWAINV